MFPCIPSLAELTSGRGNPPTSSGLDHSNFFLSIVNGRNIPSERGNDDNGYNDEDGMGDNPTTTVSAQVATVHNQQLSTIRRQQHQKVCNLINCQQTSQGQVVPVKGRDFFFGRIGAGRGRSRTPSPPSVLRMDPTTGALQLPIYKTVPRDVCPLLRHSWSQDWDRVVQVVSKEPFRTLHRTDHYNRTALHLVTFSHRPCPLDVVRALLRANRHMVLMQDKNWYTPLHLAAFFARSAGETTLTSLLCDTAIMVEQELQHGAAGAIPRSYGTSPLLLAAKRNAPLETLRALLKTRSHTRWIAPTTGGEPYWDDGTPAEDYSSPLEVLVRDRVNQYLRPELLLLPPLTHSTDGTMDDGDKTTYNLSPLANRMRQVAVDRLVGGTNYGKDGNNRRLYVTTREDTKIITLAAECNGTIVTRSDALCGTDTDGVDRHTVVEIDITDPVLLPSPFGDDEMKCIRLWEKCIELLVGHCPLLQVDRETDCPRGILHAVTCCKVPIPSLVQVVLTLFPEQVVQRDERGMIPLHHVLCANHKYATEPLLEILLSATPSDQDSSHSWSSLSSSSPSLVSLFRSTALIPFPPTVNDDCNGDDQYEDGGEIGSCYIENNGRDRPTGPTALAFALRRGLPMKSVIQRLLEADSDVTLSTMDPSTKLYPFGLVALHCEHQQDGGLVECTVDDPHQDCATAIEDLSMSFFSGKKNHPDSKTRCGDHAYYELDDVYKVLTAHPQILSLCTGGRS